MLFSQFDNDIRTTDPVKFYGIDTNPISVARSLLINDMLKNGSNIESIFELWYLSCISKETVTEFEKAIQNILDKNIDNLQVGTYKILKHWQDH